MGGETNALQARAGAALAPNQTVRLQALTWREQLALVVTMPVLFVAMAWLPLVAWAPWSAYAFGLAAGLAPGIVVYRGRLTLARARRRLDEPDAVLPMFERLSTGFAHGSAVRCDAAAHAALIRLERGELERALELLHRPLPDGDSSVRARTPSVGYFGESVRSAIGWLFPESGLEIVASSRLRTDPQAPARVGYEGVMPMLGVLRLLEAADRGASAVVRRTWAELDVEELARTQPLFAVLLLGVVRRFDASVQAELQRRFDALSEPAREIVRRRFPGVVNEGGDGYRVPAAEPSTALDRIAPAELRALKAEHGLAARWVPIGRGGAWLAFFWLWFMLALGAGNWVLGITAGMFGVFSFGALLHRRDRVRPFVRSGIVAPSRLRELGGMATRTGPLTWGPVPPLPFDRGELMLVVGLHRAEQALREGDPERAREQIGWWFAGVDYRVLGQLDFSATAASLLRMAALLGYRRAARIDKWLADNRRQGRGRSGHGNAARALGLARALRAAIRSDWQGAADHLDVAAAARPVELDAFERELYGALIRRVAARRHLVPASLQPLQAVQDAPWVDAVWPDPG